MKFVGVLLGLIVVTYFVLKLTLFRELTRDQGKNLLMAFSEEDHDKISVHLAVTMGMYRRDPPRFNSDGEPLRRQWVDEQPMNPRSTGTNSPPRTQGGSLGTVSSS